MDNFVRVHSLEEFQQLTKDTESFWLMKHSSTCPVSAAAWNEYGEYASMHPNQLFLFLIVQEDRELSNQLAEITGIKHESPQVFHFYEEKVDWNKSHDSITSKAMQEFIA
ncbi:bacillithiol system redox-active protein YtxJ [Indiicoccus explosivorum]|uniref:bacillithiol system redox-active protein YtxJ n=1 Tax=Indiicoccus explosivorum TaxID=1917864 RepID=UPI000B4466CB|nr:bacillithiol system redox-active protein YtxJ [Indiicoccus explosivorum]